MLKTVMIGVEERLPEPGTLVWATDGERFYLARWSGKQFIGRLSAKDNEDGTFTGPILKNIKYWDLFSPKMPEIPKEMYVRRYS